VLFAPQVTQAQPTGKVHRLGFLGGGSAGANANVVEAFRDGLRDLGWTEGQNIIIDYRFAESTFDRLPNLAAELVRLKVNLIIAVPAAAAIAAKNATSTIPIVMVAVTDPVGLGLIASLSRPGANVTGLSYSYDFDIHGKRLQLLKEAVPHAQRVAILSNPAGSTAANTVNSLKTAAQSLGISLQFLEARAPDDLDVAFAAMAKDRADALLVVADPLFGTHAVRLAELTARNRLPSIYGVRGEFDPGGLVFYGQASVAQQVRQAAAYVDKILKGAKPADLPVEQQTKFELVVNLKTAKALGLTIPPTFLLRADQIIE
jgi:putative tryptophan/tyrosine transport system substrate-binding protein